MENTRRYVLAIAALVTAIVVVVVMTPDDPNKVKPAQLEQTRPDGADVQIAQLDPPASTPLPEPEVQVTPDQVGGEEFYFSLASALSGEGFSEEYISSVSNLYAGFDPQDFLAVDAASLAGQLGRHMMEEFGYQGVTTDDAADILRVAREVYTDLK